MTILPSGALFRALLLATAAVGQPTSEQAGAALAAGRLDEATEQAGACLPDPECALVRGRALFASGRLLEAAQDLQVARSGTLAAHAAKLQGEALLLAGRPADALEPLRSAEQARAALAGPAAAFRRQARRGGRAGRGGSEGAARRRRGRRAARSRPLAGRRRKAQRGRTRAGLGLEGRGTARGCSRGAALRPRPRPPRQR